MQSRTGELDMLGVPPNPLPIWRHLPLNWKLPMPTVVPKGAVELYTGHIGEVIWKRDDCLDFDLWDPNLYQLPAPQEYNSLKDPHLRAYLCNHRIYKRLIRHGLITREGGVLCPLEDFNRYRRYLHNFNLNVVKTHEKDTEAQQIKDMMFSTLGLVQKQRFDALSNKVDFSLKRVRYSSVLIGESARIRSTTDPDFEGSKLMRTATEGEKRSLNTCRNIIQEDFRKAALIRLRRLQDYDDRQLRGLNDWRKRRVAQVEWLAEEKLKGEQLEQERLKHVREHMELSSCQKQHMDELIRRYAQKRYRDMREKTLRMARRICIKMHRQWPLSVRCPPNVLNEYGGASADDANRQSEMPPFESEASTVEPTPSSLATPANANINAYLQKKGKFPCVPEHVRVKPTKQVPAPPETPPEIRPSASLTSALTEHIIQNALNLLNKYSRSPTYGEHKQPPEAERDGKTKTFVGAVANEVKHEMKSIVEECPDVILLVCNTLSQSADMDEKPGEPPCLVDWDHAPVMRASSTSFTGEYVRDTIIEVAGQMADSGDLPERLLDGGEVDNQVAEAIMDLGQKTGTTDDVRKNLVKGSEMVELAGKIILGSQHGGETCDGGDNTEELSVCLITSLIRTALLKFKDALTSGKVTDEDLVNFASSVDMDCFIQTVLAHSGARERIRAEMEGAVTDDQVDKMIEDTVRRITNANCDRLNEEVKGHISDAARKFVEKIINSVFEDINPQPKSRNAKAAGGGGGGGGEGAGAGSPCLKATKKRKKVCLRATGNKSNNSNADDDNNDNDNISNADNGDESGNSNRNNYQEATADNATAATTDSPPEPQTSGKPDDSEVPTGERTTSEDGERVTVLEQRRMLRGRKFRNLVLNNHGGPTAPDPRQTGGPPVDPPRRRRNFAASSAFFPPSGEFPLAKVGGRVVMDGRKESRDGSDGECRLDGIGEAAGARGGDKSGATDQDSRILLSRRLRSPRILLKSIP